MPFPPNSGTAGGQFNLYNFRQTVGDPARPYLFLVHIPEIGTDEVVTSLARSTSLPGFNLGSVNVPFQGVNIKLGAPPEFPDWKVSFLCDEAHELRKLFLKWQSLVYDIGTGLTGHSNSYKSDQISVAQMARNGVIVANHGLVGAWPKTVGEITVGHDQGGAVEMFDVDFSMDYYVLVNLAGEQTINGSFIRSTTSVQINRGAPPPGGNWKNPFTPQ